MSRCWKTRIFINKYRVKRRTRGLARNCCECRGCLTYAEEQRRRECLPHKLSILNMLHDRKWRMWGAAKNIRWLIWPHPQRVARLTAIRHALLIAATIQSRHDMRGERLIIRVSLLFGVGWVWIGIVFLEKVTLFVVIFSSYSFIGETMSTRSAHSYCRGHMAQAQIYRQSVTFFVC